MVEAGLALLRQEPTKTDVAEIAAVVVPDEQEGEWADELAFIGKRRNVLEARLRTLVVDLIRFDSMYDKTKPSASRRVLASIPEKRRQALESYRVDEVMDRLYWLDLVQIIKREWLLFVKVFVDRSLFDQNADIVNDRPDAHAKRLDAADVALHRRALSWLEDKAAAQ